MAIYNKILHSIKIEPYISLYTHLQINIHRDKTEHWIIINRFRSRIKHKKVINMRKTITVSLATYKLLDEARTKYSCRFKRTLTWDEFIAKFARVAIYKEKYMKKR